MFGFEILLINLHPFIEYNFDISTKSVILNELINTVKFTFEKNNMKIDKNFSEKLLNKLIDISETNLKLVNNWIDKHDNFEFLAKDPETRSCTSICILPKDEWFKSLNDEDKVNFMKEVCSLLESNEAGYDLNSYKTAPPGIRIWGGSTVENKNVELVLPWIDWAYLTTKEAFKK